MCRKFKWKGLCSVPPEQSDNNWERETETEVIKSSLVWNLQDFSILE